MPKVKAFGEDIMGRTGHNRIRLGSRYFALLRLRVLFRRQCLVREAAVKRREVMQ